MKCSQERNRAHFPKVPNLSQSGHGLNGYLLVMRICKTVWPFPWAGCCLCQSKAEVLKWSWETNFKDEYMYYATVECYYNVEKILKALLDNEGRLWVERLFRDVDDRIQDQSVLVNFQIDKLLSNFYFEWVFCHFRSHFVRVNQLKC